MRLGFLGPSGTFCEEALRRGAPGDAEHVGFATERAAIAAAADGEVDAALVPIENSLEGSVTATVDALAHGDAGVVIAGEVVLPVTHCLVAPAGAGGGDLRAVVSHPQALAQCARYLESAHPGAARVAATSTAEAVRGVCEGGSGDGAAAIGTDLAARLYGGEVVARGIEDEPGNETRFVWLARPVGSSAGAGTAAGADGASRADVASGTLEPAWRPEGAGEWRTSLVFHGSGDVAPGWLVRCLSEFAFRGVNLSKIESRPRRSGLGHYLFLADLDGAAGDERVAEAIEGLRTHCEEVRILGSYRAAVT